MFGTDTWKNNVLLILSEYDPRFHTNCKYVHSCPDSCHINQFHTSTHVLESWAELRSSWHFCSEPSSNTLARQMVHVHQKPISQAKQTSCDKPQTFLNKSKWSWPCASLQTAWCLNLKSMRKLEIFSFLHWNKSLLYTVPFCKSTKASFICLVQQLEAPEFPREISAFITSRKVLLFQTTILFQNLIADLNQ